MALHSDTEIYRAVADLQKFVARTVVNLRRDVKNAYGPMLIYEAHWMGVLVRHANIAREARKVPVLEQLLDQVEVVQSILRTLRDLNMLPYNAYADALPITTSIGKQATAWKNSYVPAPSPAA